MELKILKCKSADELKECSFIRKSVFGEEENAPEQLYIIDQNDLKETTSNYIVYKDDKPVATARYIQIDDKTIKIQRMAVLKDFRKKGIAKSLLSHLEKDAFNNGYKNVILDSAQKACEFYKNNGYKILSDVFFEDNRPHIKMQKFLTV